LQRRNIKKNKENLLYINFYDKMEDCKNGSGRRKKFNVSNTLIDWNMLMAENKVEFKNEEEC